MEIEKYKDSLIFFSDKIYKDYDKNTKLISRFSIGEVIGFMPYKLSEGCDWEKDELKERVIPGIIAEIIFTPVKVKYKFWGFDGLIVECYSQRIVPLPEDIIKKITRKDLEKKRKELIIHYDTSIRPK